MDMYNYPTMTIKTAIIGASGYTGAELLRLLASHPEFSVELVTAHSQAGKAVTDLYPHLATYKNLTFKKLSEASTDLYGCELVFCGLPHGEAVEVLPSITNKKLIVDLGSDFRLQDASLYPVWYGREHKAPEELSQWTYGLTELFRNDIRKASKIANPGCYATASILAAAPVLKEKLVEPLLTINAISGLSGAGREPSPGMHFSHADEDVRAYKITSHQHTPEIEMALSRYSLKDTKVSFVPHIGPFTRGIFATITAKLMAGVTEQQIFDCLQETYKYDSFVSIQKTPAGTKELRGSNRVAISAKVDSRLGLVVITSTIDNLVKGAAGQAIQNANVVYGLEEQSGLTTLGLYP